MPAAVRESAQPLSAGVASSDDRRRGFATSLNEERAPGAIQAPFLIKWMHTGRPRTRAGFGEHDRRMIRARRRRSQACSARCPSIPRGSPAPGPDVSAPFTLDLELTQRTSGFGTRHAPYLAHDRRSGDDQGNRARGENIYEGQADPIVEATQPLRHGEPRDRPSDHIRENDRPQKLGEEQSHHIRRRGTKDFADADLVDPPRGVESRQAVESDAADQDCKHSPSGEQP